MHPEVATTTLQAYASEEGLTFDDLLLKFFEMTGIKLEDIITITFGWPGPTPRERTPGPGWSVYMNLDDFCVAVYRDGRPISAMYESSRGDLYQDEAYFIEGSKSYYAHNMPGVGGRSQNVGVWEEQEPEYASIAKNWLLGQ